MLGLELGLLGNRRVWASVGDCGGIIENLGFFEGD